MNTQKEKEKDQYSAQKVVEAFLKDKDPTLVLPDHEPLITRIVRQNSLGGGEWKWIEELREVQFNVRHGQLEKLYMTCNGKMFRWDVWRSYLGENEYSNFYIDNLTLLNSFLTH